MSQAYLDLRAKTKARDRRLRDKVTSLEAAAALIGDGEHVALGGCTASRTPFAMIWALVRAGRRDLTVSRSIVSTEGDVVITVATDSARLYGSENKRWRAARFPQGFDEVDAAELYGAHLARPDGDHVLELTHRDRRRIFNLGYFTWVEQQGIALADFDRRKDQRFWTGLRDLVPVWDEMIARFNRETGLGAG